MCVRDESGGEEGTGDDVEGAKDDIGRDVLIWTMARRGRSEPLALRGMLPEKGRNRLEEERSQTAAGDPPFIHQNCLYYPSHPANTAAFALRPASATSHTHPWISSQPLARYTTGCTKAFLAAFLATLLVVPSSSSLLVVLPCFSLPFPQLSLQRSRLP